MATEGSPVVFTVELNAVWGETVTVTVSTRSDTGGSSPATAGADYTALTGRAVTIPAGSTSRTFSVATRQDNDTEPDETFLAAVSSAHNATLSDDTTATGTIEDDDEVLILT